MHSSDQGLIDVSVYAFHIKKAVYYYCKVKNVFWRIYCTLLCISMLSVAFNYLKWGIALSHSLNLDNRVLAKAGLWLTGNTSQALVKHLAEAKNTKTKALKTSSIKKLVSMLSVLPRKPLWLHIHFNGLQSKVMCSNCLCLLCNSLNLPLYIMAFSITIAL